MRRLWFGLWLAVLGWDALLPHIESPVPLLAAIALVLAALLMAGREGRAERPPVPAYERPLLLVVAAACAVTARALPWPERLGPLLILAAALWAAAPWLARLAGGAPARALGLLGGITTGFAALSHLYRIAESELHDLDFLARPMAATFEIFGLHAAADPPFVNWQGSGVVHTVDLSLEKLVGHGFGALCRIRARVALRPARSATRLAASRRLPRTRSVLCVDSVLRAGADARPAREPEHLLCTRMGVRQLAAVRRPADRRAPADSRNGAGTGAGRVA